MSSVSVKLPLSFSPDGGYSSNKTAPESVKQNFRNLLLTNPGERIMDPFFGVGIKRFLFEQNETYTHNLLKKEILTQVEKYMPFLSLSNIEIARDKNNENIMYLNIQYNISPLNQIDQIFLRVNT